MKNSLVNYFIGLIILLILAPANSIGQNIDKREFAEKMDKYPQPVGGMAAIAKLVVYPDEAKKNGIEGKVLLKVFIDENGDVINTEIVEGIEELNQSALNAIMNTKFIPGEINGKPSKVQVKIPIAFKCTDSKI